MATALVIGSIALDQMIHVEGRLQAGSHHQGRNGEERIGGGAANTAMALARGGVHTILVSAVGDDEAGHGLVNQLTEMGVDTHLVARNGPATTRSLVMLDEQGERTIINLARAKVPVPEGLAELELAVCYVRSADPALTPVLQQLVNHCTVIAQIPPIHEPKRPATVLIGSRSDLDQAFMADPFTNGQRIAGNSLQWVILTDGAKGTIAYARNEEIHQPAQPRTLVDSTGAGDVFVAGLIKGLCEADCSLTSDKLAMALTIADAWGGFSVTYSGTVPPLGFAEEIRSIQFKSMA